MPSFKSVFYLSITSVAAVLVYSNTLWNTFVYDDIYLISKNSYIRNLNLSFLIESFLNKDVYNVAIGEIYRPLYIILYAIEYKLWGLNPPGYHLINILLHTANSALVYLLLQQLLSNRNLSLLGAMIFAVHPIHTENVAWVKEATSLLSSLLFFGALICYIRYRKQNTKPMFFVSVVLFIGSLLSKETSIIFPIVVILIDLICFRDSVFEMQRFVSWIAFFIVSFAFLWIRTSVLGQVAQQEYYYAGSMTTTILTMMRVMAYYIKLLLLPVNLCGDYYQYPLSYNIDLSVMASILLLSFLLLMAIVVLIRYPLISLGILFFFLTLLPVSNIIPTKILLAERFLYLPSFGFILSCTAILRVIGGQRIFTWTLIMVITFFSILTYQRNFVWRDHYSFWSDTVKKMPGNSRAYYNLAMSTSDLKEKINALKMSLYLNPVDNKTRSKLADAYVLEGNYQVAIKLYSDILRLSPNNTEILRSLAYAYFLKGDIYESKSILEKLVERHSTNPELLNDLGNIYRASKEYDKSIKVLEEAIAIAPTYLDAYYSLGIIYRENRKFDKAIAIYNKAMEMDPSPEKAYIGLGEIYLEKDNYPTAIEMYKKAINFNPKNIDTYYNIAYLYAIRKEFDSSLYWLKRAADVGFKDIGFLKANNVFTPLTGRVGFKELEHK